MNTQSQIGIQILYKEQGNKLLVHPPEPKIKGNIT